MEKNKGTLITIIILLIIFIPCTIIGVSKHFEEKNKNHDFYFEGQLYFYNNDNLIGTYKCKTQKCDYAKYNVIGTEEQKSTTLINNQYAFIQDGEKIYLEDIKSGWNINEYQELRSYNIPIEKNSFITKNKDGLMGVISLSPSLKPIVINKYDDVYLNVKEEDKEVSLQHVFVKEKEEYKIIKNEEEVYSSFNEIVDCTEEFVITKDGDSLYNIEDYNNIEFFDENITKYALYDNYLAVWTYYDLELYSFSKENMNFELLETFETYADVKIENDKLNIYNYEEIISSYELKVEK